MLNEFIINESLFFNETINVIKDEKINEENLKKHLDSKKDKIEKAIKDGYKPISNIEDIPEDKWDKFDEKLRLRKETRMRLKYIKFQNHLCYIAFSGTTGKKMNSFGIILYNAELKKIKNISCFTTILR